MTAPRRRLPLRLGGLFVGALAVVIVTLISLRYGSLSITTTDALDALFDYDPNDYEQLVVRTLRMPRTLIVLVVGCGLAVTGAVMQGVTRNALADPFVFGISSGAQFGLITAFHFGWLHSTVGYIGFSFVGALAATAFVYALGSGGRHGGTPVRLVLAGVITALIAATWSDILVTTDDATRQASIFLFSDRLVGRDPSEFWVTFPFIIGGVVVALLLGHQLNVLNLGEDVARSVGMNTVRVRLACTVLVAFTAGACVAAAGPIAFVGFAVPHLVRPITGGDFRWILAYSAVFGGVVLVGADVIGRVIMRPDEIEASIVMTVLSGPWFVVMARRGKDLEA